jgi:hypothetical protein
MKMKKIISTSIAFMLLLTALVALPTISSKNASIMQDQSVLNFASQEEGLTEFIQELNSNNFDTKLFKDLYQNSEYIDSEGEKTSVKNLIYDTFGETFVNSLNCFLDPESYKENPNHDSVISKDIQKMEEKYLLNSGILVKEQNPKCDKMVDNLHDSVLNDALFNSELGKENLPNYLNDVQKEGVLEHADNWIPDMPSDDLTEQVRILYDNLKTDINEEDFDFKLKHFAMIILCALISLAYSSFIVIPGSVTAMCLVIALGASLGAIIGLAQDIDGISQSLTELIPQLFPKPAWTIIIGIVVFVATFFVSAILLTTLAPVTCAGVLFASWALTCYAIENMSDQMTNGGKIRSRLTQKAQLFDRMQAFILQHFRDINPKTVCNLRNLFRK